MTSKFDDIITNKFSFLKDLEFSMTSETKGKEHAISYVKDHMECLISWKSSKQNPSLTFSSDEHLYGILDCEADVRKAYKDLPKNQSELLAWLLSAMPLETYLQVFIDKIKPIVNE